MAASYASQGQTEMESLLCGCTLCASVAVLASRTDECDRRRSEGEDRDGISLLDFVLKGTSIHADELYALSNVWIQRSRQGPWCNFYYFALLMMSRRWIAHGRRLGSSIVSRSERYGNYLTSMAHC